MSDRVKGLAILTIVLIITGFASVGLAAWWLAPTQAAVTTGRIERDHIGRARHRPRVSSA